MFVPRGDLTLPDTLREELKKPFGELVDEADLLEKLETPEGAGPVVTVGDICTITLHRLGRTPDLAIVDYKTKRLSPEEIRERIVKILEEDVEKVDVTNPQKTVTKELWDAVNQAYGRLAASDRKSVIVVDGEEDLAALPAMALAPPGAKVIYGLPDVGLILVHMDQDKRTKIMELLKKMEA